MLKARYKTPRCALSLFALALCMMAARPADAETPWEKPAADLAGQIAAILGAGQAQLSVTNRSTIPAAQLPAIRRLLEEDLRARGVTASGAESANTLRITLSENARERLWVAEIVEGSQTEVTMVHLDREASSGPSPQSTLLLQKKLVWSAGGVALLPVPGSMALSQPILNVLPTDAGLVILEQDQILIETLPAAKLASEQRFSLPKRVPESRDPRGLLAPTADGRGFQAFMPGFQCLGSPSDAEAQRSQANDWSFHCHDSDDPWLMRDGVTRAFYNSSLDFFSGLLSPSPNVEVPPFYSLVAIPRAGSKEPALLAGGIDGKVQLIEGGKIKAVSGTRDWGSDFAAIRSGCGAGTQVIASSSGEALQDSLRAYEIQAQEAIPASAPLEMGGTVTALWTGPGPNSVWAVVRNSNRQYEVDRVTALCQ